ncbi:MAG: hypothetical protein NZ561_10770 [Phycisphaerae bacterium]|nr:hypothetical protein [Phycisphaerae bacterium]MDW8262760.1 hypothetical protein [Phycisphaerales bacterium]
MKLNFWQILGLILVIVAIVLIVRRETGSKAPTAGSATTAPAQ